jgi:6-phosphofructokinase 1
MKKIAVFTSGGDAPGMNACVRAVVRTAVYNQVEVVGIIRGYEGMINGDFLPMQSSSVSNIIQRGGTILKSARSKRFMTKDGRAEAAENLKKEGVEGIVAIGGDGTFTGAKIFYEEHGIPTIGAPGTIDNDLYGTDYTIGYDTAVNTVVEAVDKIRDTADAHDRLFFVEVMGRDAGFIALRSGIGVGAEAILVPETETYVDRLIGKLQKGWERQKSSSIIIVAEGDDAGGAYKVAEKVKAKFKHYETKVTVLGHVQRGGNPTAADRVLASQMGNAAVIALIEGRKNEMVGIVNRQVVFTAFENAIKHNQQINQELLKLADVLSI